MYEIIIILLLVGMAYLFYQKENVEKKYEEKINKITANLLAENPQYSQVPFWGTLPTESGVVNLDQTLTKDIAESRMQDPLLAPEVRGPFPIANAGWAINQNPRILPGQYVNDPRRGFIFPSESDPEYLTYQQVGFLNNNEGDKPTILPLFGKKKYPRSDQWEYYYQTDKYNQIKIPITYKKNYPLMSQDVITIPEYKKDFVVTIYDYDAPKYIPYVV